MSIPLISVVIPVYREGEVLSQAIESVLVQTFRDFEIIIVNNNADDVSLSIIKKYAREHPDLIRIVDQPVQGAPSARNKGIHESRGRFIAMLEGDDIMYPNRLEKQFEYFENEKRGDISLLSSYYDRVDWENRNVLEVGTYDENFWITSLEIKQIYWVHPSTWFFEKKTAIFVGLFNEEFNPRLIEDDEFIFKMFFAGRIICIPERLARVRMPSESYQNIKDAQATTLHVIKKLDLFFNILQEKLSSSKSVKFNKNGFYMIRAQWLRERAVEFLLYENGKKVSQRLIMEAIKEKPFDFKNWKAYLRTFYRKKKTKNGQQRYIPQEDIDYLMNNEFFFMN
ncbi:MAG: glycosyltransferase family 2 protein [Leptospirales bacterium]